MALAEAYGSELDMIERIVYGSAASQSSQAVLPGESLGGPAADFHPPCGLETDLSILDSYIVAWRAKPFVAPSGDGEAGPGVAAGAGAGATLSETIARRVRQDAEMKKFDRQLRV